MSSGVWSFPREQVEFVDKCPECESTSIRFDDKHAELICRQCGFVLQDQIPVIEAVTGHKAQKVLVHPKGKRVAVILNGMIKTDIEKAMRPFFVEIKKVQMTKQMEAQILSICRKAVEQKITKRIPKIPLLCAAMYIVSKQNAIPVFFDDFDRIYNIERVEVLRTYKKLCRLMKIKIKPSGDELLSYIYRFTNDLEMPQLGRLAMEIAKTKTTDNSLMLAAASVYMAAVVSKIQISQREMCKVARISDLGLRDNFNKLMGALNPEQIREFAEK